MDNPSQEQPTQETPATEKRRINYPAHIKPLEARVLAALDSGCRTAKTVHTYVGKDVPEKVVNMKLGQLVSRGKIGRKISTSTGYLKYYPYEIAKEKGCLQEPKTRKARRTNYELAEAKAKPVFAQKVEPKAPAPAISQEMEVRKFQHELAWRDVANEQLTKEIEALRKENQRLTIIIEYYEGKAGK